jgi:hypothetical protein
MVEREKINEKRAKELTSKIEAKMSNATESQKTQMRRAINFLHEECGCTTCPRYDFVPNQVQMSPQQKTFAANATQIKLTEDINTQMKYLVSLSDSELNDLKKYANSQIDLLKQTDNTNEARKASYLITTQMCSLAQGIIQGIQIAGKKTKKRRSNKKRKNTRRH